MNRRVVVFVDTSIILRLVGVDGEDHQKQAAAEFDRRRESGEQFVLPVTALIEAGNHVAGQPPAKRRGFAKQLQRIIEAAKEPGPPWIVPQATLDQEFAEQLLAGDSTGSDLLTLLGDGRLGTGDVALLVERDQFKRKTAHASLKIWTLDNELSAHG